jgi:hypothetical protein
MAVNEFGAFVNFVNSGERFINVESIENVRVIW